MDTDDALSRLPSTFRSSEALEHITKRQLLNLRLDGRITPIARGLYRKSDWYGDEDIVEIASAAPHATIALRSALVRHDLTDDIPAAIDIAIPRGDWAPKIGANVTWHRFATTTFDIGREQLRIDDDRTIGLYSAPRTIIDTYRLQHHQGVDQANDALKRWLRNGGQPSDILRMARSFPHAQRALQQALSILL
jgi:predicted transcriptional regulator of viral defense system